MADRHYGLSRGQNQPWQATAMSPVPDVDVRINFDNGITRHEAVAALDVIKNAVLEDKWPPVDPSVPSSGSAVADEVAWNRARQAWLKPLLANMSADCLVYNTSQGVSGLQAACGAARTAGKPLKLVGSTPINLADLAGQWVPKPNGTTDRLRIFSDGEVVITGNKRIELATNLELYNLRIETSDSGTVLYPIANTAQSNIVVGGCRIFPVNKAVRALYSDGGANVDNLLFRFNEVGPCSYTTYNFTAIRSEFSDNRSYKDNITDRHFFRVGGYRNRYFRNYMKDGRTGINGLFDHANTSTTNYPYLQQFVGDIIEGNVFDSISEESVSYDVQANSAAYHPVLTLTTVQAISGAGDNSPTLQCSYDGVSNPTAFSPAPFRVVMFLTGPHAGKFAHIWSVSTLDADTVNIVIRAHAAAIPALKKSSGAGGIRGDLLLGELAYEDFTTALVGSVLMVCDLSIGAQIRNNVFLCYPHNPPGQSAITLWGNTVGFEVSGNRFIDLSYGEVVHHAIRCTTVSGVAAKASGAGNPNWGNTKINGKNLVQLPVSHGRIYSNDCGGLLLVLENQGYSANEDFLNGPYKIEVFNNVNCRGGGPLVRNWRGNGGGEYSPATPVYDTSSTWIYNNS